MLRLHLLRVHQRLLLGSRQVSGRCSECGAQLRLRPASCPLCGTDLVIREKARLEDETDPADYQSNVRALRDELERLRRGEAEAV